MYAPASPALTGGIGLLERAVNYALGSLRLVTPAALRRRTPCPDWDVQALLGHLSGSLATLSEVAEGRIEPVPRDVRPAWNAPDARDAPDAPGTAPGSDPVVEARERAVHLIGTWLAAATTHRLVSVAGTPLTAPILASAGALEVAVHGWDIAQGCGSGRPIPAPLAEELLELAPLLVTAAERPGQFAVPVKPPRLATPSDRLVAFLGRDPAWAAPRF